MTEDNIPPAWWAVPEPALLDLLHAKRLGLDDAEAAKRATSQAATGRARGKALHLLARQFSNPIVVLLFVAAVLSALVGETLDASIIATIVLASGLLGFFQEHGAVQAVDALLGAVRVHADVLRSGVEREVLHADVVAGDVVILRAGDVVPGDARVLVSNNLQVDEAALTGESYPRHKRPGVVDADAPLSGRSSALFLGSHVVSGSAEALVVRVGASTELGRLARHVAAAHVPTGFERGLTAFGYLLMRATAVLVVGIFVINLALRRGLFDSLLFSLALAVGLTPQLLPAIVTVSLAKGARTLAAAKVIVKRLDAIEDLGAMDVLCTDKTGTITEGALALEAALDAEGQPSALVREMAWRNAHHQKSFGNPIDDAIVAVSAPAEPAGISLAELPYDFSRKILSVHVDLNDGHGDTLLITKGAFDRVLSRCSDASVNGCKRPIDVVREDLQARFARLSSEGFRVLGVATRRLPPDHSLTPDDESGLCFLGFVTFADPPKAGVDVTIRRFSSLGVDVRIITGDNRLAATHTAGSVGIDCETVLTGDEMAEMDDSTIAAKIEGVRVFAEVDPIQKERVIRALIDGGHTVGYLGDGINDTPALHAADVGISVNTAVDVAKQTADLVLLDKDLDVLANGIEAGRRVFANTIKYVFVTTSANFGNMVSMVAAAAFLPFLPLLPRQILLLNFLSDFPATTIATDRVDPEQVTEPHTWDVRQIRNFMVVFGAVSTAFDILTFLTLRLVFDAGAEQFHSAWFVESTATELVAMLLLRTRRFALRSRPGALLAGASLLVAVVTVALPYGPGAHSIGLVGLPLRVMVSLAAITFGYAVISELAKHLLPGVLAGGDTSPIRRAHRAHRPPTNRRSPLS